MAFRTLIRTQVNSAFNLLDDLAEDIMFTNKTVTEYDFASGETNEDEGTTATYQGVITKMNKDPNDNTIMTAEVIFKTEDVSINDIDNYDTITFRNKNWSVNSVDDNGFSMTLIAARKV